MSVDEKKARVYVTDEMNEISPAMQKALLQTVGLITCLPNQEVKISVLNDSNFVTAMMYILSIVFFVFLVLVTFSLWGCINISNGIFFGEVMLLATFFLVLMFVQVWSD